MGGSPQYEFRDGQRLAPAVAFDFDRMAAAYLRDIGYTLHIAVRGGLRFRSEQLYLWTGWQRRLPGFNMAAHPDDPKAYHVETNPNGARAIDIYDSGPAGVGPSSGTGRGHQWMLDHAHEYNFANEGLTFAKPEAWHKRWTGANPWATPTNHDPAPAAVSSKTEQPVTAEEDEDDDMPQNSGIYFESTVGGKPKVTYMVFNTGSGFCAEHSAGPGNGAMPDGYNNGLARVLGTEAWSEVTEAHAAEIRSALANVRKGL